MADKSCPQCAETVGEAKAFCPACGHAFVDEQKRTDASKYDQADHTVQMGQTMYNAMLSDMGLNVKKEPEKRVEVLKPVGVQPPQTLQPVAGTQTEPPPVSAPSNTAANESKSRKTLWIVLALIAALVVVIGVIAIIAFVILLLRFGRF